MQWMSVEHLPAKPFLGPLFSRKFTYFSVQESSTKARLLDCNRLVLGLTIRTIS